MVIREEKSLILTVQNIASIPDIGPKQLEESQAYIFVGIEKKWFADEMFQLQSFDWLESQKHKTRGSDTFKGFHFLHLKEINVLN